jgi:hypothetical protein
MQKAAPAQGFCYLYFARGKSGTFSTPETNFLPLASRHCVIRLIGMEVHGVDSDFCHSAKNLFVPIRADSIDHYMMTKVAVNHSHPNNF